MDASSGAGADLAPVENERASFARVAASRAKPRLGSQTRRLLRRSVAPEPNAGSQCRPTSGSLHTASHPSPAAPDPRSPNRRMRSRMSGGVAGTAREGVPMLIGARKSRVLATNGQSARPKGWGVVLAGADRRCALQFKHRPSRMNPRRRAAPSGAFAHNL